MAVAMETHFVGWVARYRHRYERPGGFRRDAFLKDLFSSRYVLSDLGLGDSDVRALMESEHIVDAASAVRELFARYAARYGKTRYGNRTVTHVLSLPWIATLLPEARFIHMIRDGRDVALALVQAQFGPKTAVDAALRWKRLVSRGRAGGVHLGPLRYREVRYEELIRDPEEVVRSVCDFIDLDFEPGMLAYYKKLEEVGGIDFTNPDFRDLRRPPTRGLTDWRTTMDPEDLLVFETVAGETLARFGYELSGSRWPPSARLRARAKLGMARANHILRAVHRRLR
jgi:hypothetical protein